MIGSLSRTDVMSLDERRSKFETLMQQTYRQAHSFAMRLTGSSSEADDLVQETFVRAFRFFHRYDASLPFTNWLYRIMSNAHIDSIRRKSRVKSISLDAIAPGASRPLDLPDESPNADRLVVDKLFGEEIQTALDSMTAEFRMAVLLADVQGMAYEEIAEVMQTSVGTVRSRIHRGRKQLRAALAKQSPVLFAAVSK